MKIITTPVYEGEGNGGAAAADATKTADTGAAAAAAADAGKAAGADAGKAADTADTGKAAAATTSNVVDKGAAADTGADKPGDWPADWRERMATGADGKPDAKQLERLKRYESPLAFNKAFFEADKKINSGKPDADVPMPDPKTDAEGAKKWREERGIPADPTGYKLPDDVTSQLIDADKPILASFMEYAHENNLPPKAAEVATKWYTGLVEAQAVQQNEADMKAERTTEDALRGEYGTDYRPNMTVAKRLSEEFLPNLGFHTGPDGREILGKDNKPIPITIFDARLPNGEKVGNRPDLVRGLVGMAIARYGDVSLAGGEAVKAMMTRKAELKTIMDTDFKKWEASPQLRKEYNDILEAEAKRQPAA